MRPFRRFLGAAALLAVALLLVCAADTDRVKEERLWRHRNLGKAFYENPATQLQAVDEFRKALELAPHAPRERLNYGLALLRAGKTQEGIAELERVQKQDPNVPHTWFNLGIALKKAGEYEKALAQFRRMAELVPDEPVSHYNLGVLEKLLGNQGEAVARFERARDLDSNLAAPHFQLYNAYRQAGRREDAARELRIFQEIKKRQEGAAVPEDMDWSFYAEVLETIEPEALAEDKPVELKFTARQLAVKAEPATAGLAVFDADGDGRPDLLVWSASGVLLFQGGATPVKDPALAALRGVVSISPGDFNNDGFADLCVLTDPRPVLLRNDKGRFTSAPVQLPEGRFEKAVWLDYDHDYDLDLFLLGPKSALVRNQGEAGFTDRTSDFPFEAGHAIDGAAFRLVPDSKGVDLAVSYRDRPGVLYLDKLAGKYEARPLSALPAGARPLLAFDLDNDSWLDLLSGPARLMNRRGVFEAVLGGGSAVADLENRGLADLLSAGAVHRNQGLGKFAAPKSPAGFPQTTVWAAADFDLDGRADLAAVAQDGSIVRLDNQTAGGGWLRVKLAGVKNLKLARGAEVEVKAGLRYQKRIYDGIPLLFGLGPEKLVDTVRITWPNGLIQNEPKQAAARTGAFEEAQRLSGSCPMIFTWNGERFEFITDVLGVAPLGASAGDGQYFPVDHDEYVQIPPGALVPRDGRYQIRITEELREVSYLDQIELIAVDHPDQVEIFTNDKFEAPPFPEFRLFGVQRRILPKAARDHHGRDVLARVLKRDRAYPDTFARNYTGIAELHSLELDFGDAARDNRAVLILNGWVDWADGSTFLGAAQEGNVGLIPPYLQVKDAQGQWRTVIEDMGMPAGKPKTIAVDLSGKFLSESRAVRIVTNLCVYWDEIFLSENVTRPQARLSPLSARLAELRFRGFSRPVIHPRRTQPESFDYSRVSPISMWNPTPGLYTRYGDVRELLEGVDDRFVIMGSGDELRLEYDAGALPPLNSGWRRDFLLKVDGWAKDGDANTAYSQTVEPLPFHGMVRYPYSSSEKFPADPAHQAWREKYNRRPALRLIRPL